MCDLASLMINKIIISWSQTLCDYPWPPFPRYSSLENISCFSLQVHAKDSFLRHSTSVECLSAIALCPSSALANQNVSMDLISQSRSDLSVYRFTPSICMCLYTRKKVNTRSQNSFWDRSKMHCFQWGESSEKYQCLYICVDFYEKFPSDGCMPSRSRPERIVRINIRPSK